MSVRPLVQGPWFRAWFRARISAFPVACLPSPYYGQGNMTHVLLLLAAQNATVHCGTFCRYYVPVVASSMRGSNGKITHSSEAPAAWFRKLDWMPMSWLCGVNSR